MKTRTLVGRALLVVVLVGLASSPSLVSGQSTAPAEVSATAFCDNVTEIPKAECQALVDFYNSTNGASWSNHTGWLSTYTPCSTPWYGVTCGGGHVTIVDLDYNELKGSIPSSLGNLPNLQTLDLSINQLTGSIPSSLGSLSSLQNLRLHSNELTGGIPSGLGSLNSLMTLYLNGNELTGSIPSSLGSLHNLSILHLGGNQLTGGIPSSLGSLNSLMDLELGVNQLTGGIPDSLGSLSNLEYLHLHSNQLTGGIPGSLGSLSNLQSLWLHGNQLTGGIPDSLGSLSNLQRLYLSYNQLSGGIPSSMGSLQNLSCLYLGGNQLTGGIPSSMGSLSSLTTLDLSNNQLTGSIPSSLGNLSALVNLYAQHNPLSGALPSSLTSLTLSDFWFDDTNLCEPPDAAFQAWLDTIPYLSSTGVLCGGVNFQGDVLAGQGGAGIQGAWMTLRHKVGSDWPACAAGPTDADGHFSLSCSTAARDFRLIRDNPEGCTSTGVDVPAYATAIDDDNVEFNLPDGVAPGETTFYATCEAPPPPSGCWDADRISAPRVIADAGKYLMWYDGMQRTESGNIWGIGLAESPDGIHWSKYAGNPVLTAGEEGEWDSLSRFQAAVIEDGGKYKMWFSGGGGGVYQTGYATSTNGIAWTVHPNNPVLRVGGSGSWDEQEANAPAVIKGGSLYRMWYTGCDAFYEECSIGLAASLNGTQWLKHPGNPVLTGTPGEWDEGFAAWPAVIKNGDTWEMWYSSNGKIGRATSPNGIYWTKDPSNPVLSAGQFGTAVWQPTVLLERGVYKMWYRQGPVADSSIGYAESSDGVHWTLWPRGWVLIPCEEYEVYLPIVMKR